MNYVHAIDLLAPSGELERPSHFAKGQTIREHVIRNLLWDGGTYCLRFARLGTALHNGQADYQRGAALVGLLLGVRPFCEPLLSSPTSIYVMLANNLDQNGLYYEVSPTYATHTRNLYVDMAEEVEAMRRLGWRGIESVYAAAGHAAVLDRAVQSPGSGRPRAHVRRRRPRPRRGFAGRSGCPTVATR